MLMSDEISRRKDSTDRWQFGGVEVVALGSMIHLSVGHLEVDWGKNVYFTDHSQLFQSGDLAQVPYYYMDENDPYNEHTDEYNLVMVLKDGLSKPLEQVIDRINLLGYTKTYTRKEFEYQARVNDLDTKKFSFDELARTLAAVDVNTISADYGDYESFGKFFRRCLFDKIGFEGVVNDPDYVGSCAGEAMENLSANSILQLVAENSAAQELNVNWQFADLEEGGWAQRDAFMRPVDQENRFLIVTEGSSDAKIIAHALKLLKPHLADFFDFVDMDEGYPFTGTGNLYNFTKGLISISVQNNVVILYDNDAEGVFSFNRTVKLNVPDNMRILKLPDLPVFQDFDAIGPAGTHRADINGRAAAIECYLDTGPGAVVRWKNHHKELDVYHGELVRKRDVMKAFMAQERVNADYDFSRIAVVVDTIISACTAIRESKRLTDLLAS